MGYYFFYWLTQNLPTTVFCICLSTYVMRLTGNQGLGMLFLAVILGVLTLPGSVWLNGLFDPLATGIPNMFSDFTGHVNPGNYLLQRVFILFSGVGLAILSVIHYPRIPNSAGTLPVGLCGSASFALCRQFSSCVYLRHSNCFQKAGSLS